jgi:hypothetical protein
MNPQKLSGEYSECTAPLEPRFFTNLIIDRPRVAAAPQVEKIQQRFVFLPNDSWLRSFACTR